MRSFLSKYNSPKYYWLFLILIVGAFLRFTGSNWGLPYHLHPDEWAVVDSAISMLKAGNLKPPVFMRPDHFEIICNAFLFSTYSELVYGISAQDLFAYDATPFYIIARSFTAFWSTAMIIIVYKIGEQVKKGSGIFMAFFIAFFSGFINFSSYATPDIPLTFMLTTVTYFAIRYLKKNSLLNAALMGIFTGLAITIKYPGAIACVLILAVIALKTRKTNFLNFFTHGTVAIVAIIITILIVSHSLITDFEKVAAALTKESRSNHLGSDGLGYFGNLSFYFTTFIKYTGLLFIPLFFSGVFFLWKKKATHAIPLLWGIVYILILSYVPLHWNRWALPMYVSPLLIASYGAHYIWEKVKNKKTKPIVAYSIKTVITIISINFILNSTITSITFSIKDSRVVAKEYCIANNINLSNASAEGYTAFSMQPVTIFDHFHVSSNSVSPRKSGKKYVLISSYMYNRFNKEPEKYKHANNFYRNLDSHYPLIKQFSPGKGGGSLFCPLNIYLKLNRLFTNNWGHRGPTIKIYKIE